MGASGQGISVGGGEASQPSRMRASLVVLGMHHSGGDILAAALEQCGARRVARDGLRAMCDGLIRGTGVDWRTLASGHGVQVIEEPRLCLLFPALRGHVPDPVCIHVHRNPLDVARAMRAEEWD